MKAGAMTPSYPFAVRGVRICALLLCLLSAGAAGMPSPAEQGKEDADLQRILSRMDSISRGFHSFAAKFSQKKYTAVLKEFDAPETGEFYYVRTKDGSVMMRHEVMNPARRILTIKGATLTVYRPAIKEAQIASREKMQDIVEYLALGIGQNSIKLLEKFKISYVGNEAINKMPCTVLSFIPRDPKTAARVESITIWLKESTGTPAQYKFQEPTKDYLLIAFSEEKLNSKIPDSKFEQKLPSGIDIQKL
jgi:outer membrane lipoprotein-sorting protein